MRANRLGLVWGNHELSWTELDEKVDYLAYGLRQLGLNRRNAYPARVAIALPNRPEFALTYFATLRAGLVAVPVNPGYTGRELHQLLSDSGASVLVSDVGVLAAIDDYAAPLPDLVHLYRVGDGSHDRARPLAELAVPGGAVETTTGDEDLAVLLYTSGTEGRPKGAMLSHRALLANHTQLAQIVPPPIGAADVVLLAVPLFHAYGLNSGLGAVAYHGACGVLVDPSDSFEAADAVGRAAGLRLTALIGVPTMFSAWAQLADPTALASVKVAVSGAAPLEPAIARQFEAVWGRPPAIGYGLTEAAPGVTTTLASPEAKEGSIGRALPGVDVRLVNSAGVDVWRSDSPPGGDAVDDFDDDASGSPGTDPGEILVRGANLFSGYWPDGRDGPTPDGWWATGDVAYADVDGDLFLVDRLHELILVNGFNVYPAEVEQVLVAHPAVAEAAVIGVPHAPSGQTVKAYIVAASPVAAGSTASVVTAGSTASVVSAGSMASVVTAPELAAYCARNLARFKCPTEFEFVTELPHSATGKVRKAALRDVGMVRLDG
jgi:long-chain acyl-CoA synthetase